jgi:hypothetical protein
MKRSSLHINENYRGFVVRKLKSMDWDRIRIYSRMSAPLCARIVSAKTLIAPSQVYSMFRIKEY